MRSEKSEILDKFISTLTPEQIKWELKLAYHQMERCIQVLNGEDVEPIKMKDNGLSSDLELYYKCKAVREELDGKKSSDTKSE